MLNSNLGAQTYGSLYTDATFGSKAINATTLAVGSVAGSGDAGSGTATYTIPIAAPQGSNGVTPQVSISYNSMGSNGVLGFGWSLNGLSAISRTGKSIYYDGQVQPVNLTASDNYLLDGQRLIYLGSCLRPKP